MTRRLCALLLLPLLAACAGSPRSTDELPPDFSDEYELDAEELGLAPPAVLVEARRILDAREEEDDALEHAVAFLHHYRRLRLHRSAELDTLLAEAHARIVDALDLADADDAARHRRHRESGMAAARDALRLAPDLGPAHYWLGRLLLCAADAERSYGRLKKAIPELEEAVRLSPDCDGAGPACYLGRIYQETPGWPMLGSTATAIAWYEKAVARAPDEIRNRLWLGEAYAAARKPDKARAAWERVLAAPDRPGREEEDGTLKEQAEERMEKLKAK
jgi:tetratricopeptide (TPR) repeat protein